MLESDSLIDRLDQKDELINMHSSPGVGSIAAVNLLIEVK